MRRTAANVQHLPPGRCFPATPTFSSCALIRPFVVRVYEGPCRFPAYRRAGTASVFSTATSVHARLARNAAASAAFAVVDHRVDTDRRELRGGLMSYRSMRPAKKARSPKPSSSEIHRLATFTGQSPPAHRGLQLQPLTSRRCSALASADGSPGCARRAERSGKGATSTASPGMPRPPVRRGPQQLGDSRPSVVALDVVHSALRDERFVEHRFLLMRFFSAHIQLRFRCRHFTSPRRTWRLPRESILASLWPCFPLSHPRAP